MKMTYVIQNGVEENTTRFETTMMTTLNISNGKLRKQNKFIQGTYHL